ncbi:iron complex transport system substrate-binding protein [Enterococcus sp. DIV2402]|uniref:Iron complex transport system substrate-binding protein n=1 Tax=Candidatus Enterococcus lowellii TaxID=2230877 RepID=A0ABZ2SQ35_9ENTE|nr:ABC transporter substrate-binding protein [Enterococcus sp. DIV2402]MBO0463348.1 ABC transporter substrate-binding protein [Enterococcus sp. DIV2402]
MKKLTLFVALLGLSSFLAACTNKSGSEESAEPETKVVETEMGEVEVPINPKNVLVNWYVGDVLTLDVTPVGYSGWAQETMPFYDELKDVPAIEKWEKEELLSYEPDLIVTYNPEDYEKLSKVAPVVVISEDKSSEERLEFLGEVLGKEEEATEAIDTFETKLADAKEKFSTDAFKDKTFSIFEDWGSDSYGVYYETGSRGGTLLYDYLGLKLAPKLEELIESSGEGRGSLSYEVAADYFGDYIIWFLQEGKESEFEKTEIWKTIPAVEKGNITTVPGEYAGLFYYSDIASLTAQLDYVVENLNISE